MQKVLCYEKPEPFFKDLVKDSLNRTGVKVSSPVKDYLSKLLSFYVFANNIFYVNQEGKQQIKTLAELYLKCHSMPSSMKSNLKKMGDMSLYISGFFRESLKKKTVSVDYYMNMGRQAYKSLSDFQESAMFGELSDRFFDLAFVLFQIRKSHSQNQNSDLLSVLEHYMETGSKSLEKDLAGLGIQIPKNWQGLAH